MNTLIEILAWTSLIVSLIPNLINFFIVSLSVFLAALGYKEALSFGIGYGAFVWLAMGVWPIVFFIIA